MKGAGVDEIFKDMPVGNIATGLGAVTFLGYVARFLWIRLFAGLEKPKDGKGYIPRCIDEHLATLKTTREQIERQTSVLDRVLCSPSSPISNAALEQASLHAISALEQLARKLNADDAIPHLERARAIIEQKLSHN